MHTTFYPMPDVVKSTTTCTALDPRSVHLVLVTLVHPVTDSPADSPLPETQDANKTPRVLQDLRTMRRTRTNTTSRLSMKRRATFSKRLQACLVTLQALEVVRHRRRERRRTSRTRYMVEDQTRMVFSVMFSRTCKYFHCISVWSFFLQTQPLTTRVIT